MRKLSFVGRVHPIKNLPEIELAFARVRMEGWVLRIVGPDQDGHTAELRALAEKLGISGSVEFVGPKYGEELRREYAEADCFVLPSHSENFGSVVIEALAAGTPVVTTKGTPWKELEEYGCGKWVDVNVDAIEQALREMMTASDDERRKMGERGRRLVQEKYTWPVVASSMLDCYNTLKRRAD